MAISKIGSRALEDASVAAVDIAPGTIGSTQLAGSIANAKLANSTITINGTSLALGASGAIPQIDWQSKVVSDGSTVTTMVAGKGYFVDNTSAAGFVKLPTSASAGDTIAIKDYAASFGTNKLTIQRNGHKIQGNAADGEISTDRAAVFMVYVDTTKGWLFTMESNVAVLGPSYINASGGTETTSGDYKIHSFTGDANFVVSSLGNDSGGSDKVSYVVVAGGGGGGTGYQSGGGGGGGFREAKVPSDPYSDSPLDAGTGLTVSVQTYPITVGGGGATGPAPGTSGKASDGNNSVFSTITSAAGGGGGTFTSPSVVPANLGNAGGSGGGAGRVNDTAAGGAGNTPPVSPPQGNAGGSTTTPYGYPYSGAGGGGATTAGTPTGGSTVGNGGSGATTSITGSPVGYAGGGGGGGYTNPAPSSTTAHAGTGSQGAGRGGYGGPGDPNGPGVAGTANTGGGGGGAGYSGNSGGVGGKGIVIIRYKYQN